MSGFHPESNDSEHLSTLHKQYLSLISQADANAESIRKLEFRLKEVDFRARLTLRALDAYDARLQEEKDAAWKANEEHKRDYGDDLFEIGIDEDLSPRARWSNNWQRLGYIQGLNACGRIRLDQLAHDLDRKLGDEITEKSYLKMKMNKWLDEVNALSPDEIVELFWAIDEISPPDYDLRQERAEENVAMVDEERANADEVNSRDGRRTAPQHLHMEHSEDDATLRRGVLRPARF